MVMVFASLAPTISHAFANKNGAKNVWHEICTVQGTKRIAAVFTFDATESGLSAKSTPVSDSNNPTAMHFEHCPFCLNHATADALPFFNTHYLVILDEGSYYFHTDYLAPVLIAFHFSDHLSRAPPLLN
ncbi:MAG TPA: DUF2946 domain-containing protein [Methylotenera sp.]|nr:DUF2946 domain-containing protein [Methylotenera sp.]